MIAREKKKKEREEEGSESDDGADGNGADKVEEYVIDVETELGKKCKKLSVLIGILEPDNADIYFKAIKRQIFGEMRTKNECF